MSDDTTVETVEEPKTYEEKLAELFEVYGFSFDEIPPVDMILSGTADKTASDLNYDQLYAVNQACMYRLKEVAESGDHMGARMLTEEKVGNFIEWLKPQSIEFQILCLRTLICIYNHKHIVNAIHKHQGWLGTLKPLIEPTL